MAASVAAYNEDLLVRNSPRRGIRPPRTGSDDGHHGSAQHIKALVGFWEVFQHSSGAHATQTRPKKQDVVPRDLFTPQRGPFRDTQPPPPYEDSANDLPPDYHATEAPATAHFLGLSPFLKEKLEHSSEQRSGSRDVDWTSPEGIVSHSKKNKKAAQKQAQQNKWAGDDDEEKKDGTAEDGAGGDGGAGDGGDAGGTGGDPPGDPPGGDDDDWAVGGGKKNKKKKKKNAWEEFEEEEEKERKKKEAEEEEAAAAAGNAADAGNGANEADPGDEWGSFAPVGKKGKKGKKVATEPEPTPPEITPEPEAPAEDSANAGAADGENGDDWGGFTTAKKKKAKKGKVRTTAILFIALLWVRRHMFQCRKSWSSVSRAQRGFKGASSSAWLKLSHPNLLPQTDRDPA